jgi:hypothetical protein
LKNRKNYFGWESEYLPSPKGSVLDVPNIGFSVSNIFRVGIYFDAVNEYSDAF